MSSKSYRLREFIRSADERSLIVDTSGGLSHGPLPGLEHFIVVMTPILPLVDGLIVSPGQARNLTRRTRQDAALLVRADWTNALRGPDFVLPPETVSHIPLLAPQDALDLGASGMVVHFLLGHQEQVETDCLRTTVQLALQGSQVGLPLLVDVQPIGPRVVLRGKAIELGVSYAIEGGADGVAVPWPGRESFETICKMAAEMPVWVKPTTLDAASAELSEALELGGTGLWLSERIFALPDTAAQLGAFRSVIHMPIPQEGR